MLHYNKEHIGMPQASIPFPFLRIEKNFRTFMKTATTIEEQIELLKSRGMNVPDETKAKETLLDIGYYRLGFYWFPYEKDHPLNSNRNHKFKEATFFDNVVSLYYFDHDLRSVLSPYLYRIEVNFRTYLIYSVKQVKSKPTWFADPR